MDMKKNKIKGRVRKVKKLRKDGTFCLRINLETKEFISKAAIKDNTTFSAFLLKAALKDAEFINKRGFWDDYE